MEYDTVLFDLDGTLLNSLEDLSDSVNAALREAGYPQRSMQEIKKFVGNGAWLLVARALPDNTENRVIEHCIELFRKYYKQKMNHKTKPYDGIIDLLKELQIRNIKMGIVSNKYDLAVKFLCKEFFSPYIQVAIGENEKIRKKPSPDGVWAAMQELNSKKEKTIYVGDSDIDIQTAKNAGVFSVGITWGFQTKETLLKENPWKIVDSPAEILRACLNFTEKKF